MKPRLLLILVFLAVIGCLAEAKQKGTRARAPVKRHAGKPAGKSIPLNDGESPTDGSDNVEAPAAPSPPDASDPDPGNAETPPEDQTEAPAEPAPAPAEPPTEAPQPAVPSPEATDDEDEEPTPDPFNNNEKWSEMVRRMDRMVQQARKLALEAVGAFTKTTGMQNLKDFLKNFSERYTAFADFVSPVEGELMENKPYTLVNPAIGLTDLLKLNEWAKSGGSKPLDKERVKWVEVNSYGVSMHYEFDRLVKQVKDWGLEEVNDTVAYGYPSWVKEVANVNDGPSYNPWELDSITKELDERVVHDDEPKRHIMRSLEKMLRKRIQKFDLTQDPNFYCFGSNLYGTVSTDFDLLTDAAVYLSVADIKVGFTQVSLAIMREWQKQMGVEDLTKGIEGGYNFPSEAPSAGDLEKAVKDTFDQVQSRIDKKIKFPSMGPEMDILPGPVVYNCDKATGTGSSLDNYGFPNITDELPPTYPPQAPIFDNNTGVNLIPPGSHPYWPLVPTQWGSPPGTPGIVYPVPDPNVPGGTNEVFFPPPYGPISSEGTSPVITGYIDKTPIDPAPPSGTVSFDRFKGILEVEQVLNPDGSCKSTCPDYRRPIPTCVDKAGKPRNGTECQNQRNSYCKEGDDCWKDVPTCKGKARRCIRTSYEVQFCKGSDNKPYHWLKINGTMIPEGAEEKCDTGVVSLKERWEMQFGVIVRTPQYCEVCHCACETDIGTSHFSIAPIEAKDNHVLVAFKFSKTKDNVIRLEALQAQVNKEGVVEDRNTAEWINSGEVNKNDPKNTVQLGEAEDGNGFTNIGLDNVYVKKNQMVTGVKFVNDAGTLRISVRGTAVKDGKLQSSETEWLTRNYPKPAESSKVFTVYDRRASEGQKGPGQPLLMPENKMSIQFDASSLTKDGGQATIPQFDAFPTVTSIKLRALHAVGILYKTKTDYGGFLTTAVTNYRYPYLD